MSFPLSFITALTDISIGASGHVVSTAHRNRAVPGRAAVHQHHFTDLHFFPSQIWCISAAHFYARLRARIIERYLNPPPSNLLSCRILTFPQHCFLNVSMHLSPPASWVMCGALISPQEKKKEGFFDRSRLFPSRYKSLLRRHQWKSPVC